VRASRLYLGIAVTLLSSNPAFAQQPLELIRPSSQASPTLLSPDVIRQRRVEVSGAASLFAVEQSRELRLELFPDVTVRAVRQRIDATASGLSWVGRLEGYPESDVIFVAVGDELVGNVYAPFGVFRIAREGGGYLVQQVDLSQQPQIDDAVIAPEIPVEAAARTVARSGRDSGTLIDVMVVYTQDALNGFTSEERARAAIDLSIAGTNQAFRNSAINSAVRLVHSQVVAFAESGTSATDLPRLQGRSDGFLDDIHTTRDRTGADLVVLITETMTDAGGRGYLNGPSATGAYGFAVVSRRSMGTARTFVHEIGHNLGVHHDWYVESSGGAFRYSKGYVSVAGRFLDVMAYFNLCGALRLACASPLMFSNPGMMRDGLPTGVPPGTNIGCPPGDANQVECDADSAGTINRMAAVVARFQSGTQGLLSADQQILPGEAVLSDNREFRLIFQADGNLVLFDERTGAPRWATSTSSPRPGRALMQSDGNLVVFDAGGVPLWSSNTAGNPYAYLLLQSDGNLVIYSPDGAVLWHRFAQAGNI
jgi:hypothetical protein